MCLIRQIKYIKNTLLLLLLFINKQYCYSTWINSIYPVSKIQYCCQFFYFLSFFACFSNYFICLRQICVWTDITRGQLKANRTRIEWRSQRKSVLEVCLTLSSPLEWLWHTVGYRTVCERINTESFSRIWTLCVCVRACVRACVCVVP